MKITNFNITTFNILKDKKWVLGNNILYKMCSDHPNHINDEEIRAKIWLIGRSYAAAIERRKKHLEIKGDKFYDYITKEFIKFNKEIKFDEQLKKLKNAKFNQETLKEILELHNQLTKFFRKITGLEKRSLASKYLHFHCPIFPIYDSRANNSIKKIVVGKTEDARVECDKDYFKFCSKMLFLYDYIKDKTGRAPTLREIDTFLIKNANNRLNKKNDEGKLNRKA